MGIFKRKPQGTKTAEEYYNLGNTYRHLGQDADAITAYKKAIAIKPDYADAHLFMGHSYSGLERYTKAIAAYKKCLAIKPDFFAAYLTIGHAYLSLGEYEDAIAAYNRAIALEPDDLDAYNYLSSAYYVLGKYPEAIAAYKRVIALEPTGAQADNAYKRISEMSKPSEREHHNMTETPQPFPSAWLLSLPLSVLFGTLVAIPTLCGLIIFPLGPLYFFLSAETFWVIVAGFAGAAWSFSVTCTALKSTRDPAYRSYLLIPYVCCFVAGASVTLLSGSLYGDPDRLEACYGLFRNSHIQAALIGILIASGIPLLIAFIRAPSSPSPGREPASDSPGP